MIFCRACLSSDKELFQCDDNFALNYNLLTNINVKFSDGRPQSFCQTCMEAVNCFIEFRNKCISAECALKGILDQAVKSETPIKVEVKSEKEDYQSENDFDSEQHDYGKGAPYDIKKERSSVAREKRLLSHLKKKLKKKINGGFKNQDKGSSKGISVQLANNNPTCGLCGKEFGDTATHNKHVEEHTLSQGCQLCSVKFERLPQLFAHRILHTANHQGCHLCAIRFKSHLNLEYHYRKNHYGEKNITMECSLCQKKFSSPRRLSKHIWANHGSNEYTCDICSKTYNNKQKLKSHVIGHGDAKPYVCELCGYRSKYATGLAAHNVRRHAPSKRICKICGSAFADADKFARHACNCTSQICPVCGKSVRRGLARHMRTHTEERHYKCERCPAAYKSRSALKEHRDKHDNNPTQQCEYCHARFYSGSVLIKHRRVHTERHYKSRSALKQHRDKHDNNPTQQCEYCHARFYSGSVLIKHRRVHTGEKPYACKKCDMRFTGNHNLKVHMKVHGENLVVKRSQPTDDV